MACNVVGVALGHRSSCNWMTCRHLARTVTPVVVMSRLAVGRSERWVSGTALRAVQAMVSGRAHAWESTVVGAHTETAYPTLGRVQGLAGLSPHPPLGLVGRRRA
jgi:hypothetical protein